VNLAGTFLLEPLPPPLADELPPAAEDDAGLAF